MRGGPLVAVTGALALAACSASSVPPDPAETGGAARVSVEEVTCADDVAGTMVGRTWCGLVTVPVTRDGSAPGTLLVHVARLTPPGGASDRAPVLVVPMVAATPNYLGLAPMAQRTGREVVIVDARGAGHSLPALTCPELTESASTELLNAPEPAAARADYLAQVARCGDRLRADGVELGAFTVAEVAADLADVRRALGIERWVVAAFGSAGRFVPTLMALDGAAAESVLLDSIELPTTDPLTVAVRTTPRVVADLLDACARDRACGDAFPGARTLWSRARREVGREPIRLRVPELGTVVLDEALLVRLVRSMISDGGSSGLSFTPPSVPAVLHEVVHGGGPLLRGEVAPLLAAQDPFCLGYHTDCLVRMSLASGAYLSLMCHDVVPFSRPLPTQADPVLAEVLARRADPEACALWDVGEAQDAGPALEWATPTLALAGRFAPYSPVAALRSGLSGLPAATLLVDPAGADNVLPRTECLLTLRRAWLDEPSGSVDAPDCLAGLTIDWYLG